MRSDKKNRLKRCELILSSTEPLKGTIAIYNPDLGRSVIDSSFIIALPDNRMDARLTEKIGNSFILI